MKRLTIKDVLESFKNHSILLDKYFPKSLKKEEDGYTCHFIDLETGKFVKEFFEA